MGEAGRISGRRKTTAAQPLKSSIHQIPECASEGARSVGIVVPGIYNSAPRGHWKAAKLCLPRPAYTGNIELTAHFKVAANAPGGPGMAVGKLRYQACSNKACYPPKTIDVNVPYQIQ